MRNGTEVPPKVAQLFSDGFTGRFRCVFATSCVFQVIFPGTLAVGARFLTIRGIMENIQKLLSVLSGLVEQRDVLRIADVRRCTSGVHNHGAAVAACSRTAIRVIIALGRSSFALTRLRILHDHLIDLTKDFGGQPLTEIYHQGWVKRQLFIVISGIAAEVLQIRVLLDL